MSSRYLATGQIDPSLIDHTIQTSGVAHHHQGPWSYPNHRFSFEQSEPHYPQYAAAHFDLPTTFNGYHIKDAHRSDAVPPLPSAILLQQRQGSPSDQPCSTYSSTHSSSSGEESDYGFDHLPLTPRNDGSAMSPFASHSDLWNSSQLYQLTGLATSDVKTEPMNYYQSFSNLVDGRTTPKFLGREFSMSSHGTSYDLEPTFPSDGLQIPRQLSPAEMVPATKDEIHVSEQTPESYAHVSFSLRAAPKDSILVSSYDDQDADYKPSRGHRRIPSNSTRSPGRQKRAGATVTPPRPKRSKGASGTVASSMPGPRAGVFACDKCTDNTAFHDETSLEKHIKQQHTRPFICIFGFAGCPSTFAAKNEWKRHVATQHLFIDYWRCDIDSCAKVSNSLPGGGGSKSSGRSRKQAGSSIAGSANAPKGAIFNRKDLFTQHLKRMHMPLPQKKPTKLSKDQEEYIRACQDEAHQKRFDLPSSMLCPAEGCNIHFEGRASWDDRMEHVAKHLEKAANNEEPLIDFGGEHDPTLTEWAASSQVAVIVRDTTGMKKWKLNNPFKTQSRATATSGTSTTRTRKQDIQHDADDDDEEEEDAPFEDDE